MVYLRPQSKVLSFRGGETGRGGGTAVGRDLGVGNPGAGLVFCLCVAFSAGVINHEVQSPLESGQQEGGSWNLPSDSRKGL